MSGKRSQKGSLTIEASISYSIFLMVIVTFLYIIRIVYLYGLVQHAVSQTAKELSMYSYLYQVSGVNDLREGIADAVGGRTQAFHEDVGQVITFYEEFSSGDTTAAYNGTTDPKELLKNIGAAMLGEAGKEVNQQLFEMVARSMIESYIGADSKGRGADERLKALRVVGGLSGLHLSSSSFFEDGKTIDLIVCYTIDPIMPIDLLPEQNLANRAYVQGISGTNVFGEGEKKPEDKKEESVWEKAEFLRGKAIQEQEKVRNLPEKFSTFCAYDSSTGTATAACSIDVRDVSYQKVSGIKRRIRLECNRIDNFKDTTYEGITLKRDDIKQKKLIIYIPSSTEDREIHREIYDQAVKEVQAQYPDIQIVTKEID